MKNLNIFKSILFSIIVLTNNTACNTGLRAVNAKHNQDPSAFLNINKVLHDPKFIHHVEVDKVEQKLNELRELIKGTKIKENQIPYLQSRIDIIKNYGFVDTRSIIFKHIETNEQIEFGQKDLKFILDKVYFLEDPYFPNKKAIEILRTFLDHNFGRNRIYPSEKVIELEENTNKELSNILQLNSIIGTNKSDIFNYLRSVYSLGRIRSYTTVSKVEILNFAKIINKLFPDSIPTNFLNLFKHDPDSITDLLHEFMGVTKYLLNNDDSDKLVREILTRHPSAWRIILDIINLQPHDKEPLSESYMNKHDIDDLVNSFYHIHMKQYDIDLNTKDNKEIIEQSKKYSLGAVAAKKCIDTWKNHLEFNSLPDIFASFKFKGADYTIEKLDPRSTESLFLGRMVNCCQYIGGDSENCVIDGVTKKTAGFYVVRDGNKKIIAQSYAWMSECNGIVCDSLESLDSFKPAMVKILEILANKFNAVGQKLYLGSGGGSPKLTAMLQPRPSPMDSSLYLYRDSENVYLIALKGLESIDNDVNDPKTISKWTNFREYYDKVLETVPNYSWLTNKKRVLSFIENRGNLVTIQATNKIVKKIFSLHIPNEDIVHLVNKVLHLLKYEKRVNFLDKQTKDFLLQILKSNVGLDIKLYCDETIKDEFIELFIRLTQVQKDLDPNLEDVLGNDFCEFLFDNQLDPRTISKKLLNSLLRHSAYLSFDFFKKEFIRDYKILTDDNSFNKYFKDIESTSHFLNDLNNKLETNKPIKDEFKEKIKNTLKSLMNKFEIRLLENLIIEESIEDLKKVGLYQQ